MGHLRALSYFSMGAIFFAACGTAEIRFPYKYYHASPVAVWDYPSGQLRGDGPDSHKKLEDCKPVRNSEGKLVQKCVVVFYDELTRLTADYKNTKQQLIDCQRGVTN